MKKKGKKALGHAPAATASQKAPGHASALTTDPLHAMLEPASLELSVVHVEVINGEDHLAALPLQRPYYLVEGAVYWVDRSQSFPISGMWLASEVGSCKQGLYWPVLLQRGLNCLCCTHRQDPC